MIKSDVDEQMANGIGKELRIRGYLPEDFTMLAYGGNGPLHACGIADHAGSTDPRAAIRSVFSACGAGNMQQMHIHERGAHVVLYDATNRALLRRTTSEFNAIVEELEAQGPRGPLRQDFAPNAVEHRLELDMRYGNQLVTTAVVADITGCSSVGDVLL